VRSSTEILIKAMRILATDIQSEYGVSSAAIYEATQRLEEQQERIIQLESENDAMRADLLLWGEKEAK